MIYKAKNLYTNYKYWIISSLILFVVFLSFMQMDLLETSYQGFLMSQGNVLNFYEVSQGSAYLPSTYILFGLWNIPTMIVSSLMGVEILDLGFFSTRLFLYWNKLLPVIFYIGCSVFVYRIMLIITKKNKLSKLVAFTFFTAPIAVYSQFIFGQYDSLMVFFCLAGIYYYLQHNLLKFTICFAIAITFKYTPVVIYLPLLLMGEKRVTKLIQYLLVLIVPTFLEFVIFKRPESTSNFLNSKLDYITGTTLSNPYFSIQIVILAFVLLCAYAYFNDKPNEKTRANWSFFYCNIAVFLLFGLSAWHPQWLLLAVPFWVISTYLNKNSEMFLLIDVLMMAFFVFYVAQNWRGIADQELLRLGMFGQFLEYHGNYKTISDFIPRILSKDTCFTVLSSLMLVQIVFKHPRYAEVYNIEHKGWMRKAFYTFLGGLFLFLIPCGISVVSMLNSEKAPVNIGKDYISIKSKIDENYNLQQVKHIAYDSSNLVIMPYTHDGDVHQLQEYFVNLAEQANELIIPLANNNEFNYTVEISNIQGDVLYSGNTKLQEGKLYYNIDRANLEKGESYYIEFKNLDNIDSLFKTTHCTRKDLSHSIVNGSVQDFDIAFKITDK